jgi:hypothetical protein
VVAPAKVNNIPRSFQQWQNIAATPLDFNLDAGNYGLLISAGTFGTVTLQKFLPDGAGGGVYLPVSAALAANGYTVLQLSAGQYQVTLAGITAFTGEIAKIDAGRA